MRELYFREHRRSDSYGTADRLVAEIGDLWADRTGQDLVYRDGDTWLEEMGVAVERDGPGSIIDLTTVPPRDRTITSTSVATGYRSPTGLMMRKRRRTSNRPTGAARSSRTLPRFQIMTVCWQHTSPPTSYRPI
ncbi:MAG: hypothetical protein ABEK12_04350 [Candidatus Nanohaloarchaea archaeon]